MEQLKHECGVALIRLRKPLEYFQEHYGTWTYGLDKLYLLMEKQHNRGQEGAGLAVVKLQANPGEEYLFRERALGSGAITEIFNNIKKHWKGIDPALIRDAEYAKQRLPFAGEIYMGHLRYSTTGRSGISFVHPFLRRNNWRAKNLCMCGNFNLTNVDEIFADITELGQHPRKYADTYIMLELLGHRLDREVERLFNEAKEKGLKGMEITNYIEDHVDLANMLRTATKGWDGGYVICGVTGSGESYAMRDPWGIRTAFWYADDDKIVLASERPVIQTALGVDIDDIHELQPGQALFINKKGDYRFEQVMEPKGFKPCSFERIYFSRGSDRDIYRERKDLGHRLIEPILKAIDHDIDHTVISFIPNTAEVAFYGMLEGLDNYLNQEKIRRIEHLGPHPTHDELNRILARRIRSEKVAIKDIKLRTFITEGESRNDLAAHVYDITYGSLVPGVDNLVVIDDSIVRGTTLRQSILGILDRLGPKKIVVVSSSPQVRYPDYYGIDMSSLEQFIAFRAAVSLLERSGRHDLLRKVYDLCKAQEGKPKEEMENYVKLIYAPFSDEDLNLEMVRLLKPDFVKADVELVFQPLESLHQCCPDHEGDWYFSGDYPTPGGVRKVNAAYIDFYETTYGGEEKPLYEEATADCHQN